MQFTVPIFERTRAGNISYTTLGLGPHTRNRTGKSVRKVEEQLVLQLKALLLKTPARDLLAFDFARGIKVEKVRIELPASPSTGRGKLGGIFPLILEPRWANASERMVFVYHPLRQEESFPLRDDIPLEEQARIYFGKAWIDRDREWVEGLYSAGKERVKHISFSAEVRSVFEDLPEQAEALALLGEDEPERPRRGRRNFRVLSRLGVDLVREALANDRRGGVPMSPYRERMGLLLGAAKRQPTLVVGAPGVGKTTLIHQWIEDAIAADGFSIHQDVDRVRCIYRISGKRLIAGMSHVGEWEKRCLDLLDDARRGSVLLVVEDLHLFGRIGHSRESDRCLADLFRGPLARREIVLVGECTPEALRMLEDDAPTFASLFTAIHLPEASRGTTFRLMVHEMRHLERLHRVQISPFALRTLLDVGTSLLSSRSLPGKALDALRELARQGAAGGAPRGPEAVVRLLSQKTGVPERLLRPEEPLDAEALEAEIGRQIIGQPDAVRAATNLILKIKAGLTDPRRPYGVILFTGPTGTGKTELCKCIAEVLYGSTSRLLRLDMSEFSGPDAPARLIGHRYDPVGLLTRQVLEQPFGVLLLDEIEKAHPSVHNLFLQLFEDGRLTDASGTTAYFTHTVVVMTSNLGSQARSAVGFGESTEGILHDIARAVREFFAPELFNRIDSVVPFRPLTPDAATRIAGKEIDKLLARRGLSERNIFVSRSPGVVDRIAREAFRAEDGARSVKRYLEDTVGALLASSIAGGAPAAVKILRLSDTAAGFDLHRTVLQEADPIHGELALEALRARTDAELLGHLADHRRLIAEGDEYGPPLSERIRHHLAHHNLGTVGHSDEVFQLDSLRAAITAFEAEVEELLHGASPESDYEELEDRNFGMMRLPPQERGDAQQRVRLFDRRMQRGASARVGREQLLDCLAESFFLRRASRLVGEPGQHAIFIDIVRGGRLDENERFKKPLPGLLEWYVGLYARARGTLEGFSAEVGGKIVEGSGAAGLEAALAKTPTRVVLRIVGLSVLDYFALETGSHLLRSITRGSELVRVRVFPALQGERPAVVLRPSARLTGEHRDAAPSSLPLVRIVRFDPPERATLTTPVELEDFALGYGETVEVKTLADALLPLFRLRMSRTDAAPRSVT